MKRLEAWLEGRHAGTFNDEDDSVEFVDDEHASTPISLSLPREGRMTQLAAGRFNQSMIRRRPRSSICSRSTRPLDTLSRSHFSGSWCSTHSSETLTHMRKTTHSSRAQRESSSRHCTTQYRPRSIGSTISDSPCVLPEPDIRRRSPQHTGRSSPDRRVWIPTGR